MKMDVIGLDRLLGALTVGGIHAAKATVAALYREGQIVFAESQEEVPVDTGSLRASGHIIPPVVVGDEAYVEIVYGGPAAPYAFFVHENLEAYHVSPTKAKYLEGPANRRVEALGNRIILEVEGILRDKGWT
jgi:hypothetical protein